MILSNEKDIYLEHIKRAVLTSLDDLEEKEGADNRRLIWRIVRVAPKLDNTDGPSEPSIREIIRDYYREHKGVDIGEAEKFRDAYILALLKRA